MIKTQELESLETERKILYSIEECGNKSRFDNLHLTKIKIGLLFFPKRLIKVRTLFNVPVGVIAFISFNLSQKFSESVEISWRKKNHNFQEN